MNTKKVNYGTAVIMALGIAAIGTIVGAVSYSQKAHIVIENQTVNGSNVIEAPRVSSPVQTDEGALGASRATGAASTVTNFARKGVSVECDNPTSTRCLATIVETVAFPKATTTMVLQNPLSTTSTVALKFFPKINVASSTYQLTCQATSTQSIPTTMNLEGIVPTSSPRLFTKVLISTSTLPFLDSMLLATSTRQPFLAINNNPRFEYEGRVPVGGSQDMVCVLQNNVIGSLDCLQIGIQGGCEPASSTANGFDYDVVATWQHAVTSTDLVEF